MPFTLPAGVTHVDLGDVLRLNDSGGARVLDLRVDGGMVFGRSWAATDDPDAPTGWQQMPFTWVMQRFSDNSPLAAWLREHGVDVVRMTLVGMADAVGTA
jgi:hypothetical protein